MNDIIRYFWNPIYRVETNAYVLYMCDRLFQSAAEYTIIQDYIINGIPDGFVAPDTKDTSLHKIHDPKFEPSPYNVSKYPLANLTVLVPTL